MKRALAVMALVVLAGCNDNVQKAAPPAESQGSRYLVEGEGMIAGNGLATVCDKVTGDRLYLYSGEGKGIAVVPGGCK